MAFQPYLVRCDRSSAVDDIVRISRGIRALGGLILLATRGGGIICAFDDSKLSAVKKLRGVCFVGGVSLNLQGESGRALQRLFAEHLLRQGIPVGAAGAQRGP